MTTQPGPGCASSSATGRSAEALSLARDEHVRYIQSLDSKRDELEYWLTEHLRLNGVYWGLTTLALLGQPGALPRAETIEFVLSCQHASGGFGAAPGHDAHMLYTVSAVQILAMLSALDALDSKARVGRKGVAQFMAELQCRERGTFAGDEWGETDTRFLYGALNALSILGELDHVDVPKAVEYVQACANPDGGFGVCPGAESHAGQVFTCLGALSITGQLHLVDAERIAAWLSERQLPNGGFNGRPEKLEDVCYSWWVGSSLAMLGKLHWIDCEKLQDFILRCQSPQDGGFADRPEDAVDVFHTCFAVAGLSLLKYPGLAEVDPV